MTAPTVLAGTKLLIMVGDGNSPETFAQPCGLTTRAIDLKASTNTTLIPDCTDPEAPAWEAKDVNALSAEVSGSGVLAIEALDTWVDWFTGATAVNCKIVLDDTPVPQGHFVGAFILSDLKITGQRGQKINVDVTMVNNGTVTWAPGS